MPMVQKRPSVLIELIAGRRPGNMTIAKSK
jgi:hypothetical protein